MKLEVRSFAALFAYRVTMYIGLLPCESIYTLTLLSFFLHKNQSGSAYIRISTSAPFTLHEIGKATANRCAKFLPRISPSISRRTYTFLTQICSCDSLDFKSSCVKV